MPTAKTPEQWAYLQAMEADQAQQRASAAAVQREFHKRVEASRESGAVLDPSSIKSWGELYGAKTAEIKAQQAAAEAARIAALTPRDLWMSTRTLAERRSIQAYEDIRGMPYPFEVVAK